MTLKKLSIFIVFFFGVMLFTYFVINPIAISNFSSKTFMLGGVIAFVGLDFKASIKLAKGNEYPSIYSKLKIIIFHLAGGMVVSAAVLGLVTSAIAFIIYSFGLLTSPERNPTYAGIIASIFVLLLGYILFQFRLNARALYGFVELLVGLGVAYAQVQNLKKDAYIFEPTIAMSLLTASVYLVVRAMDNMNEGRKSDKLIQIWRKYRTKSDL